MGSASSPEGPGYDFFYADQRKTFGQNQDAHGAAPDDDDATRGRTSSRASSRGGGFLALAKVRYGAGCG
jgi:hypothetical protein